MKIGIYCRVSSEEQKKKGISIHDQKQRGIEFCRENDYDYEVFSDAGYSGSIPLQDRPGLKLLFDKIYLEEINGIYIVDWDRISRKKTDSFVIKEILIKNNIEIHTASGKVNFDDETSDLLNDIKILLAEHEIQRLKTRIKRSLERSIKEGRVNGGPMIAFGYTKGKDKKMIIEPDEADVVRLIYKLSIEGNGTRVIANYLNENNIPTKRMRVGNAPLKVRGKEKNKFVWRDSTIHGILTNTLYYGDRKYKGKIYPSVNLKIVEKDEFLAVQETLKKRKHFVNTRNKYFYLLKGLVYCTKCDSRFYGRKREDLSDNQYICSSQRHKGEFCGNRGINIDKLNDQVWESILKLPSDIRNTIISDDQPLLSRQKTRLKKINDSITKLNQQSDKLVSYFLGDGANIDAVKRKMEDIDSKIKILKEKARLLEKEMNITTNKEEIIDYIEQHLAQSKKNNLSDIEKQNIIRALVKFIGIHYVPKANIHYVWIEYKISSRTQYLIGNRLKFNYKSTGWHLQHDGTETDLLFRKITPDISDYPKIRLGKDHFGFRLNDIDFSEANPFQYKTNK